MPKNQFRTIMIAITIAGIAIGLFATEIWSKSFIYHPDAVTTVHNDTTNKNTQAYAIGKMQVYIDQTYRMDMPLFQLFVNGEGMYNDPGFQAIEAGNSLLSLNSNDPDINPNPFIMRLKIRNLSKDTININAQNFKIRDVSGNVIPPNNAWQEQLARAGIFSGAGTRTDIGAGEEKVLWLVYGTKTEEQKPGYLYQEYVRINYDSDIDWLATKVEFPFNYTADTPIGNYSTEYQYVYNIGFGFILVWIAFCGIIYYRKSQDFEA